MTKDWDAVKSTIHKLYMDNNIKLDDVMNIMRNNHDFIASERAYKIKFKGWNWIKKAPIGTRPRRSPRGHIPRHAQPVPRIQLPPRDRSPPQFRPGLLSPQERCLKQSELHLYAHRRVHDDAVYSTLQAHLLPQLALAHAQGDLLNHTHTHREAPAQAHYPETHQDAYPQLPMVQLGRYQNGEEILQQAVRCLDWLDR